MTKKLYLPLLMAMVVALFSSCSKKMGELSADYFTVTPQGTVDDTQTVAGKMLGIKCTDKNPDYHADCYDDRCKT